MPILSIDETHFALSLGIKYNFHRQRVVVASNVEEIEFDVLRNLNEGLQLVFIYYVN